MWKNAISLLQRTFKLNYKLLLMYFFYEQPSVALART